LGADRVFDVVHQAAHARGVGAEIERAVARGGARVDTHAVGLGPHADHDVIAKSHDRGARNGFDPPLAPSRLGRACVDDAPSALVDHRERGVVGRLHRRIGSKRTDVRIGGALLFGGIEAGIGGRVGIAHAQPR
jgi:hypothetical protein